jgi:hypothetical protein
MEQGGEPKILTNVLPGYRFENDGKLYGNSANCKFAFAVHGVNTVQNPKRFVKVQINPNEDDVNVDSVVGALLNDKLKNQNQNQDNLRLCTPKYIDCCQVFVEKNYINDSENVKINKIKQNPVAVLLTCKANIQDALDKNKSLFEVNITNLQNLHKFVIALGTLQTRMNKLGTLCGFVHNDAHLGNLQQHKINNTDQISFIDLGRVGLLRSWGSDIVKEIINKVLDATTKNTGTFLRGIQRHNLDETIFDNKFYIPATKTSFLFDISTIVLGVLESFSKMKLSFTKGTTTKTPTVLEYYLYSFNKRLEKLNKNNPKLSFEIDVDVDSSTITMSTIQTLNDISKIMSPANTEKEALPFYNFDRYVIAGLLVFALVSIRNKATDNVWGSVDRAKFRFSELIDKKIMWRYYQYTNPVTKYFCREVGCLCHRVLSPGKPSYPDVKLERAFPTTNTIGGKRQGKKNYGGFRTQELPKGFQPTNGSVEKGKSTMSSPLEQVNMDAAYSRAWKVALQAGLKAPPRPPPGYKPVPLDMGTYGSLLDLSELARLDKVLSANDLNDLTEEDNAALIINPLKIDNAVNHFEMTDA